jgi:hypothetical protein
MELNGWTFRRCSVLTAPTPAAPGPAAPTAAAWTQFRDPDRGLPAQMMAQAEAIAAHADGGHRVMS